MTQAQYDAAQPLFEEKGIITDLIERIDLVPASEVAISDIQTMLNEVLVITGSAYPSSELETQVQAACLAFKNSLKTNIESRESDVDTAIAAI